MCGINGIVVKNGPIDDGLILAMNRKIVHRGPDEEGVYREPCCHMGMRRLSIIDLADGHQPIFSEDGRYAIVFNGEIYNYRTLRSGLVARGHHLTTNSDTEVIVHLYEEKKEKCLDDLNGMFAFAIYDRIGKELFIARDRLGKKPLYYTLENGRFLFASELKSLYEVSPAKRRLCLEAVESFFALTFIPSPLTIFEGVHKLPPGHYMKIGPDLSCSVRKYWDLADTIGRSPLQTDHESCKKTIRDLLTDSISLRMISDVPLGVFLSGGVDSSIILSVMSELSPAPIRSFSIGNTVKSYDESQKAIQIARHFRAEHTEWMVDNDYICSVVDKVTLNFDEPFADSSALPTYVVAELARKNVTVVLTGDGGDEVYAGYTRYLIYNYLRWYRALPGFLRNGIIRPLVNALPAPASFMLLMNKVKKIANSEGADAFEQYHDMQRLGYSESGIRELLAASAKTGSIKELTRAKFDAPAGASDLARCLYADIAINLPGDMLAKLDRTSMQNSLEARCPFLDYRLVEHSFTIPDSYKMRGNRLKAILKETFEGRFPPGFLDKPKMGFGIPIGLFLRNELRDRMWSIVRSQALRDSGLFNMNYVENLFKGHLSGRDRTFQLWPVYVFGLWLENNMGSILL
jgi:asparagine synthase (glutamine-hydrolysing)